MATDEQQPNKIVINSFYKENSESNDDFTCLLPANLRNVKALKFQTIVFPNSMLPFKGASFGANQNNTLRVIDDTGGTPNAQTITIDENLVFPSADDFATYLEGLFNTTFGAGTYTIDVDPLGDKLDISRSGGATFTLDVDNSLFTSARKLGFVSTTSTYTDVTSVTAEQSLFLARTSVVYVHTNVADGDCLTDQQQDRFDIALVVPINTNFGFIQTFQSSDDRVIRENLPTGVQRISITLRDEEGDLIGLADRSYVHLEIDVDYTSSQDNERKPGGNALGQRR